MTRFKRLKQKVFAHLPPAAPASRTERIIGMVAGLFGISGLGFLADYLLGSGAAPYVLVSMGASAVLLFAAPHSPLSHPWSFVVGHLVSATVGISCGLYVEDVSLAAGLAVGGSIFAMQILRCLHPPGGATALFAVLGGEGVRDLGYGFLAVPLGVNLLLLLGLALLLNNLVPARRYPMVAREPRPDRYEDPLNWLLNRTGLKSRDLEHALNEIGGYIDVSRDDLHEIYARASLHAFERRMGKIVCADIMSRDPIAVEYGSELEDVWQLMRKHKLKGLPVVDRGRRVIGIVTIVDILKRADARHGNVLERLVRFVRRTPGLSTKKPESAGEIMTPRPITAREDEHILTLVPLFHEHDIHHIPVVGRDDRLVGMITQSDLMAALYNYRAGAGRRVSMPTPKMVSASARRSAS